MAENSKENELNTKDILEVNKDKVLEKNQNISSNDEASIEKDQKSSLGVN